jgi:cobalt-zinc-cadmium efflux system outer membrane protein
MRLRLILHLVLLLLFCGSGNSQDKILQIAGVNSKTAPWSRQSALQEEETEISLGSLVQELFHSNPDLAAAKKRLEASQTRPFQEGSLPDPKITMGWLSNGNPLPGAGLGVEPTSNIGFQLSQGFPYPGKRSLKSTIARKEAESTAMELQTFERFLVKQLKTAFYELEYVYDSIEILVRNREVLQRLAKVADSRYTVGRGIQQDLIRAQLELTLLEKKLIAEEQKKASLKAQINTLLNRSPDSSLGHPQKIQELPSLGTFEELRGRAEQRSSKLKSQRAMIDSKQFGVQLAQRAYYPDFDVMGGYYNMGGLKDMWEFKVQLNIPIYFWRKQRLGLEESSYRLVEAQKSYRATEQELFYRVRDQFLAAQTSKSLLDLYKKRLIPQAQLAMESSLTSYESGAVDFLTVLSNFSTILENEKDYCEQRSEYLKAMANLEESFALNLDQMQQQGAKP